MSLFKPVAKQEGPPAPLGLNPELADDAQLELAVEWIAWLDSRKKTIDAATEQAIALKRAEQAGKLQLLFDGERILPADAADKGLAAACAEKVSFADFRARLEAACEKYCTANRSRLFPKLKTFKLPAGNAAFRNNSEAVGFVDDKPAQDVLDAIVDAADLRKQLTWILQELQLLPFVKCEPKLDLAGVKAAIEAGTVTDEQLAAKGLKRIPRTEGFSVKPNDVAALGTGA